MFYEYSSTQDRKLWIDDILLKGFFYEDKDTPKLSSFIVEEQNEILLNFDEDIDTTEKMLFILNRKFEANRIEWISASTAILSYNTNFDRDNLLEIYGITDLKGNVCQIESVNFQYFSPELHDVLISEIMADPNPIVKLPECEYIELYNRSAKPLNLKGWNFSSGTRSPIVFEDCILEPGKYVLLVDNNCFNEFPDSIQKLSFLVTSFTAKCRRIFSFK